MTKRICIVGTSCSGKTTLAGEISRQLGIPHIELDALHWKPNWEERADDEFLALVEQAVAGEHWVSDGNYNKARHILWPRATTIIWLDYPFALVLYRAITRTIHRVFTRKKLYADNVETFRMAFLSRESIILWVIQTYGERRGRYLRLLEEERTRGTDVQVMKRPAETRRYLESLCQ